MIFDEQRQPEKVVIKRVPQKFSDMPLFTLAFSSAIHHKVRVLNSEKNEKWRVVDEDGSVFEVAASKENGRVVRCDFALVSDYRSRTMKNKK